MRKSRHRWQPKPWPVSNLQSPISSFTPLCSIVCLWRRNDEGGMMTRGRKRNVACSLGIPRMPPRASPRAPEQRSLRAAPLRSQEPCRLSFLEPEAAIILGKWSLDSVGGFVSVTQHLINGSQIPDGDFYVPVLSNGLPVARSNMKARNEENPHHRKSSCHPPLRIHLQPAQHNRITPRITNSSSNLDSMGWTKLDTIGVSICFVLVEVYDVLGLVDGVKLAKALCASLEFLLKSLNGGWGQWGEVGESVDFGAVLWTFDGAYQSCILPSISI